MSNKIISLWFCLMLAGVAVRAQDPRFSQYFASPMTLNPALTGNIDGSLRVAVNFRQQWWAASSPFQTTSLSFEHRLFMNSLGRV